MRGRGRRRAGGRRRRPWGGRGRARYIRCATPAVPTAWEGFVCTDFLIGPIVIICGIIKESPRGSLLEALDAEAGLTAVKHHAAVCFSLVDWGRGGLNCRGGGAEEGP